MPPPQSLDKYLSIAHCPYVALTTDNQRPNLCKATKNPLACEVFV